MDDHPDLSPVTEEPAHHTARKAGGLYLLIAIAWLVGAELLVGTLHHWHHVVFVGLTSAVVYGLVLRSVRNNQSARARLAESERRYRILADNAADVIWTQDAQGQILYISPSVQAQLGYSPAQVVQDYARFLAPDSADTLSAAVQRQLDGRSAAERLEIALQHADGGWHWLEVELSPLRGAHGQTEGVLGVGRDITARRAAQQRAQAAQQQLIQAQKLEAIGTLAGGVAHDLNNLLAVIMGNIELARLDGEVEGPIGRRLESIYTATERAGALTARLLLFSRRARPTTAPLSLNRLLQQHTADIQGQAGAGIAIRLGLAPGLPDVAADPHQLVRVILELVANARDAMPGGGTLTLETDALAVQDHPSLAGGRYVRLRVQDTGPGMDEETRRRAFEPFFTTRPVGASGLGLSTAYGVLCAHGGLLALESHPGQGTTLTVLLPAIGT